MLDGGMFYREKQRQKRDRKDKREWGLKVRNSPAEIRHQGIG